MSPPSLPSSSRLDAIDSAHDRIMLLPSHMPAGYKGMWHCHRKGQLIYPRQGRYRLYTRHQVWSGSPRHACWVPAGVEHTIWALDALDIHNAYLGEPLLASLPTECRLLPVMPLLEALLSFGAELTGTTASTASLQAHTLTLIADIIAMAHPSTMPPLPLSKDTRIQTIMEALLNDPADEHGLEHWASHAHCSPRTLARYFRAYIGMSFSQWRQQLRVAEAIARLESGHPVKRVAYDLGYASQSAFASMFRRVTGLCPTHFKAP